MFIATTIFVPLTYNSYVYSIVEDTTSSIEKGEKKSMENEKEVDESQGISKVKDFVKNLNQETCPIVKDDVDDEMVQTSIVSLAETLGDSIQMVYLISYYFDFC